MNQPKPRLDWHRLSNVDREARTAICSICGHTRVRIREGRSNECMTVRNANRGVGDPEKRKASKARAHAKSWADPAKRLAMLAKKAAARSGKGFEEFDVADYELLLHRQGGRCAICLSAEASKALAIDHDHATGTVRGLLCAVCNTTLGRFRDDAERFERAASYLRRASRH